MAPPSRISIATGSLNRLVKEEASYHREQRQQQDSITKLEQGQSSDENAEYQLRQERKALEETKALFPRLRLQIQEARAKLEQQLEDEGQGGQSTAEEITKAKEAVAASLVAEREIR
ncbi:tubulin-specific chaperone Rbl2 [Polychaeton citri CBS 116435]|uniref:Tubulin-specific chaperone A n=1 Tax=Polychaeton citri CBS 116435 TaxID=1314669 RepID=A0A9P4Q7J7_9PEZI|nr:tubulin-specific chaperone Rbl2 [Polychaeton citri CBS 116435]